MPKIRKISLTARTARPSRFSARFFPLFAAIAFVSAVSAVSVVSVDRLLSDRLDPKPRILIPAGAACHALPTSFHERHERRVPPASFAISFAISFGMSLAT
jgi:hypothetical protein